LRALHERGITPTIITGSSTGSLVAAAHASEQLDALETWARDLSKIDVWRLVDANFGGGGFMSGNRLFRAVGEHLEDRQIESLKHKFGAVAVDLYSGREVWIQTGSMLEAVRASSGLPGLFTPTLHSGRWLIDGGVVNPVPVSLCRALGADYVIAVNINHPLANDDGHQPLTEQSAGKQFDEPGVIDVMQMTIGIMQEQIDKGRMLVDPPDLLLTPYLDDFQLMDFHRAAEAIEIGYTTVEESASDLPGET
jgi:NTE family protein